jgi:glycosyltransferase involved in cell wall biosynthesis
VKLTVTVITHNEAHHIADALQSVAWADEIIVIDSRSTDDTVAIARRYATRVEVREWPGYSMQKNYAATLASNDWILSLDADERASPELAAEIRETLQRGPEVSGYRIPRITWYLGQWIRTTDWYPDYQLRLYDRRAGRWNGRRVHESVDLTGPAGTLRHEIRHYAYRDVSHHLATIDRYTTLAAEQWIAQGRRTNPIEAAIHPPLAFIRNYLLRGGIRDGAAGFLVSVLNSYYVFLKLVKLWELQRGIRVPAGADRRRRAPFTNSALVGSREHTSDEVGTVQKDHEAPLGP